MTPAPPRAAARPNAARRLIAALFPPPHPRRRLRGHRYAYETVGTRGRCVAPGDPPAAYRFDSPRRAYRAIYAMLGGHGAPPMFDYMTPLERIDLDTGERCLDFPER